MNRGATGNSVTRNDSRNVTCNVTGQHHTKPWRRNPLTKPGASSSRCRACGTQYGDQLAAGLCCIAAPDTPNGWCAWCGDELEGGVRGRRIFCDRACGVEYTADVLPDLLPCAPTNFARGPRGAIFAGEQVSRDYDGGVGPGARIQGLVYRY